MHVVAAVVFDRFIGEIVREVAIKNPLLLCHDSDGKASVCVHFRHTCVNIAALSLNPMWSTGLCLCAVVSTNNMILKCSIQIRF